MSDYPDTPGGRALALDDAEARRRLAPVRGQKWAHKDGTPKRTPAEVRAQRAAQSARQSARKRALGLRRCNVCHRWVTHPDRDCPKRSNHSRA